MEGLTGAYDKFANLPLDHFRQAPTNDPLHDEHVWIETLLTEFRQLQRENRRWDIHGERINTDEIIQTCSREELARLVQALIIRLIGYDAALEAFRRTARDPVNPHNDPGWKELWGERRLLFDAISPFLRRKLPLSPETRVLMLEWVGRATAGVGDYFHPLTSVVAAAESLVSEFGPTPEITGWIEQVRINLEKTHASAHRKLITQLQEITGAAPELPLEPGEAWADAARAQVQAQPSAQQTAWAELLTHCRDAKGSSPNPKWQKAAKTLVERVGVEDFRARMAEWFPLTAKARNLRSLSDSVWAARCMRAHLDDRWEALSQNLKASQHHRIWQSIRDWTDSAEASGDVWGWFRNFRDQPAVKAAYDGTPPDVDIPPAAPANDAPEDKLLIEPHMDILRGLAWACGLFPSPELARALTALALSAFRKVPGKGPRAVRVGTACLAALGTMGGLDAVGQLAVLKVKVKFGTAQKQIEKALESVAERAGVPKEELEEMSVPSYGLTDVGVGREELGEHAAELRVQGTHEVALVLLGPDGKERKSLPAPVKEQFKEELKELSAAKKDIEKLLPALVERIDALFLAQKSWPLEAWLERYLQHPLMGVVTRRLIWNFTTRGHATAGIWHDGKIVQRDGAPVELDPAETRVSLWHPLDQSPEVVLAWRVFLEDRQIRQPFKQAHREVYLLTPAEENTRMYSNRFAAHLLRQHQFNALCAARGWKNKLRLMVDDSYAAPCRELPQWGLRAEFWVESAGDNYGTDTNESGVFLHVATDQVRFYPIDAAAQYAHAGGGGYSSRNADHPLPLAEVPPLVFSEIMRDVDLFVGVASVGNDPTWRDGRSAEQHGAWQRHAFGDLSATAKTRREVLQRLVPRLKIAAQCSFEDKFLIVAGKLRKYKIHLGSGNILMSPNDQYLCIVASRGKADTGKLFLPFEGDSILSVVISKALLLAADDKITDPSITQQIGKKETRAT
jgi:hypothetical protein